MIFFFANDSKYTHIIYRWKLIFTMSMDSRSLPQNKASFSSDLLTKFCHFTQKSVSMIRELPSRTEATTVTRKVCWAFWYQGWPPKLTEDRRSSRESWPLLYTLHRELTSASPLLASCRLPFHRLLNMARRRVWRLAGQRREILRGSSFLHRERNHGF